MHVKERGYEDGDWVKLAQDRDKLRAVVSTIINFCFPYSEGVGWLGKELLVYIAGWLGKELLVFILGWLGKELLVFIVG